MIYQEMPRRNFIGPRLDENKGFFLEGRDYEDCLAQLVEWCGEHPEKWVYYHNCGMAPAYPVPVARHVLEVYFFDEQPARPVFLCRCIQEGCGGMREIDRLSEQEKAEILNNQLFMVQVLGSAYR